MGCSSRHCKGFPWAGLGFGQAHCIKWSLFAFPVVLEEALSNLLCFELVCFFFPWIYFSPLILDIRLHVGWFAMSSGNDLHVCWEVVLSVRLHWPFPWFRLPTSQYPKHSSPNEIVLTCLGRCRCRCFCGCLRLEEKTRKKKKNREGRKKEYVFGHWQGHWPFPKKGSGKQCSVAFTDSLMRGSVGWEVKTSICILQVGY